MIAACCLFLASSSYLAVAGVLRPQYPLPKLDAEKCKGIMETEGEILEVQ